MLIETISFEEVSKYQKLKLLININKKYSRWAYCNNYYLFLQLIANKFVIDLL